MFRRSKDHFTLKIQKNDGSKEMHELPYMITLYMEGQPFCDIVYNTYLNRYVIDPSVKDFWCVYTIDFIISRVKEYLKDFIKIYDPIILENDRGHYKSKEFTTFIPKEQRCPSCDGKTKRYYGDWEDTENHQHLATCKACGGTGRKK